MCLLAIMLFASYVMYFRADGGSIKSGLNILKGLNSHTFNYLQSNSINNLKLNHGIRTYDTEKQQMTSIKFWSECVKFNRPCIFDNLAK